MWEFWVDRGGTFTDLVAKTPEGALLTHKLLSDNPDQYDDAAIQGIRDLMGLEAHMPLPPHSIKTVKMGTTVATNALLERKGSDTLLLITQGFKDLLRIGYQNRPKLFDLAIKLPQLLYCEAFEIKERLDFRGNIVTPLDLDQARARLKHAFDRGIRSVAIAFMHAYVNPAHEREVGALAHEIGFTQISTSHETSPLIKLVGRADTTVADAYLSPILASYIKQVEDALSLKERGEDTWVCERLFFMQSNGGLTDAACFKGKDSILSGPAGGVVGMIKTAQKAGFDHIIGFDMGGTSTDVCHYAGELERSFETELAGIRMRAPMMHVHTVAAGGGSLLSFEDGRYQVGPQSAGADPGPACYRRKGPLTVTDCNVALGKLNADHFPALFGPNANQKLDTDIVSQKFQTLAAEIANKTQKPPLSVEETAAGFLKIAIENMANAIKKISVERGYDITGYTLNCFGGAAGQHACLIADRLGMERVFIHPFAGVLSAFGMGLADIRVLLQEQFEHPLAAVKQAQTVLDRLAAAGRDDVVAQGVPQNQVHVSKRAHLRYEGSHQILDIPFDNPAIMATTFDESHKQRFGFSSPGRALIFDMLSIEAIGQASELSRVFSVPSAPNAPNAPDVFKSSLPSQQAGNCAIRVPVYLQGSWCEVPLIERSDLKTGLIIKGPAIIIEPTGTNMVEPGWKAHKDPLGNLILERYESPPPRKSLSRAEADPIMLEIFNNLFMSIADQMGATLANTAYSVNIKERLDFSCALFDASGGLVANAPHIPVHLGSMSESVRAIARQNAGKMCPGDSFMLNNPYNGGTHLPDVTVITPVFDQAGDTILFFVGSRGHHADIGGSTPGSAPPDSTHIEQEGVIIDNFKLVEFGRFREDETRALLASGPHPCRNIDENIADLEAQIAANATGIREVYRMINNFGLEAVHAYMGHVQANAEACVRAVIDTLSDCAFCYEMDSGQVIKVRLTTNLQAREVVLDFTGTSPQHQGNYNAPLAVCRAVVLYVFRLLTGKAIPLNEGCLKPLKIIAPEGSMINPRFPAAVISGNTEVSQAICDCLLGALGIMAGSQGTMNNFIWGNERFQNYETIGGGSGAGRGFNGANAVQVHMTNTRMTDPEVLEKRFPVRIDEFAIRKGSGGRGTYQGGDGIYRRVTFLENVNVTTLCSCRIIAPYGLKGGEAGACGENRLIRKNGEIRVLKGNAHCKLRANDSFEMFTPGGGGYGLPKNV